MAENLRYPIKNIDYPGQIVFTPLIEKTVGANELATSVSDAVNEDEEFNGNGAATQTKTGKSEAEPGDQSCILYLPGSLAIADGVTYNNVDLGTLGGAAEASLAGGGSALGGIMGAAKSEAGSFIDSFKSGASTDASKLATNKLASSFGGDAIGAAVKSQSRVTTNPNTRALFESVPLRSFSFSFSLVAQSALEAEEIKKIIYFFRNELYPEEIKTDQQGFEFSIGYKFPNRFQIKTYYGDKEVATKIQYSYLTSFSATYNANGMGMHSDGNFQQVDIAMEFLESRAMSKGLIKEGF